MKICTVVLRLKLSLLVVFTEMRWILSSFIYDTNGNFCLCYVDGMDGWIFSLIPRIIFDFYLISSEIFGFSHLLKVKKSGFSPIFQAKSVYFALVSIFWFLLLFRKWKTLFRVSDNNLHAEVEFLQLFHTTFPFCRCTSSIRYTAINHIG